MATLEQLENELVRAGDAGDTSATSKISEAMRAHPTFQRNATQKLNDGSYKVDKNYQKLDKGAERAEMSKLMARSMGLKDSEVDVTQGMGTLGRMALSFKATDEDKFKSLEDRYGRENIRAIDIGGKQKMLYRDQEETGGQFRAVDEEGTSLADFFGDTAGHVVPTVGAVGAAVATGGASIPIMAGASALGYLAAGVGQDTASRAIEGEDLQLGESFKRRGIEAAIGVPIDLVTGVGGKMLGKAFAKRASLGAIDDLVKSTDELNLAYKTDIKLTAAQAADPDASMVQSQRAGLDPKGREAAWYNDQLDELGRIKNSIESGIASDEPIEGVMMRMADSHLQKLDTYKQRVKQLDEIEFTQKTKGKKQSAEKQRVEKEKLTEKRDIEHKARVDKYNKEFDKMRDSVEKLERKRGREVRGQVAAKKVEVEANNNSLYERAYELTDTPQANTPVSVVGRALKSIDDSQFIPDSPELMALQALKKRIATDSSDLTFRELDSFVRQFGDRVNFKKEHGLKFNELSFKDAYKRLNAMWNTAVGAPRRLGARGAGKSAREAHMAARKDFRKNVLPYTDGEPSKILQKRVGGLSGDQLADEKVLSESLKDSASVRNALKAGADKDTLRDAYIDSVIKQADSTGKKGRIKIDENVFDALYGRGGKTVKNRIDRLNRLLEEQKVSPKTVTKEDVRELVEAYDAPALRRAEQSIKTKIKAQKQYDEANNNVLMKVIKGEQPAPEDIHIFVDDIAKLSPGNIDKVMSKLSKPEQDSLRRSGLDWMLQKAGASDDAVQRTSAQTGGESLWNPDQMHNMLTNKVQRSKLEALVGKDIVKDYDRMNKVLGNAAILRQTSEGAGSRVVLTTGATGVPTPLIVSPGIPRWLGRKMLGIIHTSPTGRTMLRRWLQSPDKKSAEELFQKIFFTSIATRGGMVSAASEAKKDPQFSAWMQEAMRDNEAQPQQ